MVYGLPLIVAGLALTGYTLGEKVGLSVIGLIVGAILGFIVSIYSIHQVTLSSE